MQLTKQVTRFFGQFYVIVFCGLASCTLSAVEFDLRPYAGPDAPLLADRLERKHQQWRALTVERYLTHGNRQDAYDEAVIAFLSYVAAKKAGAKVAWTNEEALASVEHLTSGKDRCRDLMFNWAKWQVMRWAGRPGKRIAQVGDDTRKHFFRDNRRRDEMRYSALMWNQLVNYMVVSWGRPGRFPKTLKVLESEKNNIHHTLYHTITQPFWQHDPEVLLEYVNKLSWKHQIYGDPGLAAVYEACPDSTLPEAVQFTLQAAAHVNAAWAWRGSGWASTVTPEGWENFRKNLDLAAERLEQSWQLDPTLRVTAKVGVIVSSASRQTTQPKQWLYRGAAACFDDLGPYYSMLNFLKPRWGGSYRQMAALGVAAAATERYDTEVPWFLVKTLQSIISDTKRGQPLPRTAQEAFADPTVLGELEKMLAAYAELNPHNRDRYQCKLALAQYHGGLYDQAKATLATVADPSLYRREERRYRITFEYVEAGIPPRFENKKLVPLQTPAEQPAAEVEADGEFVDDF